MTNAPTALDPLDGLTIPVPCTVPWETMTGDERRRFCGKCRLHVHDLSAMTRAEAIEFLGRSAGARTCVRFARRPDGRVLTRDCREAVRALRRRAALAAAALVGALGLAGTALALTRAADRAGGWSSPGLWDVEPFSSLARWLPASWLPSRPPPFAIAGAIAPPPNWSPPTPRTPPAPQDAPPPPPSSSSPGDSGG